MLVFFLILIFLAIGIIVYYLFYRTPDPPIPPDHPGPPGNPPDAPLAPAGGTIIDCAKYGNLTAAGGLTCPTGTQDYGGYCYTDVWTAGGGTKTAVCTVDYGPPYTTYSTHCGIGIYYLNYGDPCPMVGPGYYKTAVCTCQYKGLITGYANCQSQGYPSQCPIGSDSYEGSTCYSNPCPTGYTRTGRCSCAPA